MKKLAFIAVMALMLGACQTNKQNDAAADEIEEGTVEFCQNIHGAAPAGQPLVSAGFQPFQACPVSFVPL